jgi:hypothetical protein
MKIFDLKSVLILSMLLLVFVACNRSGKSTSESNEAVVEVEVFDAVKIKNEIVQLIQQMPDLKEIAEKLQKAGATYILDLTVPVESAEKMLTASHLGIGLGMYAFDIQYANVYNRVDKVNELIDIEKQLVVNLGIESELSASAQYAERLKNNSTNKDSIDILVTKAMNDGNSQLADSNRPDIYAYAVIGGNVEAMYVMSQLALLANDNTELLILIDEQRGRINTMFSLFELMSADPGVKPVYEGLLPVFNVFENNDIITEDHLFEIAPVIEKVRNKLI